MEGRKVIMVTIVITMIGIFVGTIGYTAIDSLEGMVDDAEDYQETTVKVYKDDFELRENETLAEENQNNQSYNLTEIRDGDIRTLQPYVQMEDEIKTNEITAVYINGSSITQISKNGTNSGTYKGESNELINITVDLNTSNWTKVDYNGDYTYSVDVSTTMTVYTNHTHTQSTINLLSLIPIITAVGIVIVLIALVVKVIM